VSHGLGGRDPEYAPRQWLGGMVLYCCTRMLYMIQLTRKRIPRIHETKGNRVITFIITVRARKRVVQHKKCTSNGNCGCLNCGRPELVLYKVGERLTKK
jgi:hypothetical protein